MIPENIKEKLPAMFTELRDLVNRAEMISRSGNVRETCLLLTEITRDTCGIQTLLLQYGHVDTEESVEPVIEQTDPIEQKPTVSEKQEPMTFMMLSTATIRPTFEKTGERFYAFRAVVHDDIILLVKVEDTSGPVINTITGLNQMVEKLYEIHFEKPVYIENIAEGTPTAIPLTTIHQLADWLVVK